MIRLYLTDDHQQITDGLQGYLQSYPEFEIVGVSQTGEQTIADLAKIQVDILILDIRLPDITGKQVFDSLKKTRPKVLVSSMEKGIYFVRHFIENGAEGYVLKENGLDELVKALKAIAEGETFYSESVKKLYKENKKKELPTLTRTETKIFTLKYQGMTTKEIADKCCISDLTVEKHLSNIFDKYFEHDTLNTDKKDSRFNLQKLIQLFNESGYIYELTGQIP
jgi:DNA-binding NarL/FixJ family response regulator